MTNDDKKIKPKPDQKNDAPPKEKGVQEPAPSEPSGGRKAAETLNVQLEVLKVHRASDFDAAFLTANQRGVGAMVIAIISTDRSKRASSCGTRSSSSPSSHYAFS